MLKQGSADMD